MSRRIVTHPLRCSGSRAKVRPPVAPIDEQAEAELCRRFRQRIRLYGLRHLRTDALADDLVQQVLLLTLQSLREGRVREPERIASFVLGACRMITLELRRGESRRERLLEQYGAPTFAAHERPAELDLDRLRACVEKLPTRERTVVLLSFYDGAPATRLLRPSR